MKADFIINNTIQSGMHQEVINNQLIFFSVYNQKKKTICHSKNKMKTAKRQKH